MLSTFTASAELIDIEPEFMEPDSVVVAPVVLLDPLVFVEPATVPFALLSEEGCVAVVPVVAPVVPPVVVPVEAPVDPVVEVFDDMLPEPLAPIELEADDAASHVPFTSTLWPTWAVRSCEPGSSCTPEGCFLSISMNMPADWLMQPFSFADLPDASSLFALLDFELELMVLVSLWGVAVWSVLAPLPAIPVLLPVLLLPVLPALPEPPELCAIIATQNADITMHVNRMRFTLILLGNYSGRKARVDRYPIRRCREPSSAMAAIRRRVEPLVRTEKRPPRGRNLSARRPGPLSFP